MPLTLRAGVARFSVSFVFPVPSPISFQEPWDSNVDEMQILGNIEEVIGWAVEWGKERTFNLRY